MMKNIIIFIMAAAIPVAAQNSPNGAINPIDDKSPINVGGIYKVPASLGPLFGFNQDSTTGSRFSGGLLSIYPLWSSKTNSFLQLYGTTVVDLIPQWATDAATGKSILAFSTSIREGLHERLYCVGPNNNVCFFMGMDLGPTFPAQNVSTVVTGGQGGLSVSLTTDFTATAVWQINKYLGLVVPVRALQVTTPKGDKVWNPVMEISIQAVLPKR
jgi:hypothetical protein